MLDQLDGHVCRGDTYVSLHLHRANPVNTVQGKLGDIQLNKDKLPIGAKLITNKELSKKTITRQFSFFCTIQEN